MSVDGHVGDDAIIYQRALRQVAHQRQDPLMLAAFIAKPIILDNGVIEHTSMTLPRHADVRHAERLTYRPGDEHVLVAGLFSDGLLRHAGHRQADMMCSYRKPS